MRLRQLDDGFMVDATTQQITLCSDLRAY